MESDQLIDVWDLMTLFLLFEKQGILYNILNFKRFVQKNKNLAGAKSKYFAFIESLPTEFSNPISWLE